MRRRRYKEEEEDEELTFDDLDDEEEEDAGRPRRPYVAPRPIRTHFYRDPVEDIDADEGPTFEELEPKIRAGKYKPKQKDPWTAHVLYNNLRDLGEI